MNPFRPGIFHTHVVDRRVLCREHFELRLACGEFPPSKPGQFIQVLCRGADDAASEAMLRRPFSIAGLWRKDSGSELSIIGRVVGPGTAWLDSRQTGDPVNVLGPLGSAFEEPSSTQEAILVAGGVGLPPIRWLAESLSNAGTKCKCIFGAQTRDLIPLLLREEADKHGEFGPFAEEFAKIDVPIAITTDDGSYGMRGRVTDCLRNNLSRSNATGVRVYACGPEPMLHAIANICAQVGVACSLAMERVMGCGMGTCQSCVIPVRDPAATDHWRYALCCTEGPVFDAPRIIWPVAR